MFCSLFFIYYPAKSGLFFSRLHSRQRSQKNFIDFIIWFAKNSKPNISEMYNVFESVEHGNTKNKSEKGFFWMDLTYDDITINYCNSVSFSILQFLLEFYTDGNCTCTTNTLFHSSSSCYPAPPFSDTPYGDSGQRTALFIFYVSVEPIYE